MGIRRRGETIFWAFFAGADHQASRKVNKLGKALRKCAPDEHACRQESNPNGSSLCGASTLSFSMVGRNGLGLGRGLDI